MSRQCCIGCFRIFICMIDRIFCHLNVPVTEFIPHKVVNLGNCNTKFELIHIFCNIFYKGSSWKGSTCQHVSNLPVIHHRLEITFLFLFIMINLEAFHTLLAKLRLAFYTFVIETHIITRCITCDQCHTKCICTISDR